MVAVFWIHWSLLSRIRIYNAEVFIHIFTIIKIKEISGEKSNISMFNF
jgi:hypothetical protein